MTRYEVSMTVEFLGEIEADSAEEAERLAIYDETCQYLGVDSIDVTEIEEEEENLEILLHDAELEEEDED